MHPISPGHTPGDVLDIHFNTGRLHKALVSNLGALWDESRSLLYMMERWQETCREADEDASGTISVAEAVILWTKVLRTFTQFVRQKLEMLGVASPSWTKHVQRL